MSRQIGAVGRENVPNVEGRKSVALQALMNTTQCKLWVGATAERQLDLQIHRQIVERERERERAREGKIERERERERETVSERKQNTDKSQ